MKFPVPTGEKIQKTLGLASKVEHIGTGGFKAVYRFQNDEGRDEAIKAVYIPPAGTDEEVLLREQMVARAKREIVALGECDSPYLVKLGSVQAELHAIAGHDYLTYGEEFLPGEPLTQWIGRKPLPELGDLHAVFTTLIHLIGDLIKIGYLHRDIKPENIMDTGVPDRRFVLLDLGIAYKVNGTELTRAGNAPGTVRYMAPELLAPDYKDNMDFRCDLYAAGLTIYVLASGTHPFAPKPEHEFATAYRIMTTTPTPLQDLRPDLPLDFCRMVDRCIKKKPALRYTRLEHIKETLKEVAP